MLATPADTVPEGDDWLHEVKWDGMRVLAHVSGSSVRLTSRTERDISVAFPELIAADAGLQGYDDLLLDGEVVILADGVPSFAALAERFNVSDPAMAARLAAATPATFLVFDVLQAMNRPTLTMPLRQRRQLLEGLELGTRFVQVPPTFTDGAQLAEATAAKHLEGVVSKRAGSPYRPGRRSPDWRKIVHRRTDSFVVCGWLPERDNDLVLGSVYLATPTPEGPLLFRGRVGSGLAGTRGATLLSQLRELRSADSPFEEDPPGEPGRGAIRWVRPELVADVEFLGISDGGQLRQPSWRGIRHDLRPQDLIATEVPGSG
ncbi:ATP-dependent DNA ligase [Flexivirga endophytica]|uniref:DNA ligase (ATP) n=2 Tax=Flexivirga endophytica TaxID=1849103 RepID=A0A916T2F5_9MICO|nr:ATP-dependent DNA ligase [Flexivirga endophytica]